MQKNKESKSPKIARTTIRIIMLLSKRVVCDSKIAIYQRARS